MTTVPRLLAPLFYTCWVRDVTQAIFGNRRAEWHDLYHGPGLFRRAGRAWGAVGAAARSACS